MKRNYYGVLGIDQNASMQDIRRAYKKLAFKYHPDKNESVDAMEKFKKIKTASEVTVHLLSELSSIPVHLTKKWT